MNDNISKIKQELLAIKKCVESQPKDIYTEMRELIYDKLLPKKAKDIQQDLNKSNFDIIDRTIALIDSLEQRNKELEESKNTVHGFEVSNPGHGTTWGVILAKNENDFNTLMNELKQTYTAYCVSPASIEDILSNQYSGIAFLSTKI